MSAEIPGIEYVTVEPVAGKVPLPNRTGGGGLRFIEGRSRVPKMWLDTLYFKRRMRTDNGPAELRIVPEEKVAKKPRANKGKPKE